MQTTAWLLLALTVPSKNYALNCTAITNMISEIINEHAHINDIIFYLTSNECENIEINHPKIVFNININPIYDRSIDFYITTVLDETISDTFAYLSRLPSWNSRAKFIFASNADIHKIFETAANYYVYNIIVLNNTGPYTYFPYNLEDVSKPDVTPVLITNHELFPEKLPKQWRNSTLKATAVNIPPYVVSIEDKLGLDVILLENIIKPVIGFKIVYDTSVAYWGSLQANGSYTLGYQEVFSGKSDFGIGFFHVRWGKALRDFDVSTTYTLEPLMWQIPAATEKPRWKNLVCIFKPSLWIVILATILLFCMAWVGICNISPNENYYYKKISYNIVIPILFVVNGLTPRRPSSNEVKLLFVTTWVFTFLVRSAWEGQLISHLTQPSLDSQIKTAEEAILQGFRIGISTTMADLYLNTGTPFGRYIHDHNQAKDADIPLRELYRSATKKDSIAISNKNIQAFLEPQWFISPHGNKLLYSTDEYVVVDHISMPFRKGHPCYNRVNDVLLLVPGAGFMEHIDREFKFWMVLQSSKLTPQKFKMNVLTLKHIKPIFAVLVIGQFISFGVFLSETVYYKLVNRS